jgi:hypothetical protein
MCLHFTGATLAVLLGVNLLHVDLNPISLGISFSYCVCFSFSVHNSVNFVCCFVSHFLHWISKENIQTNKRVTDLLLLMCTVSLAI